MKFSILICFSMFLTLRVGASDLAIVGDSTSTGLFTNSKIELNVDSLLEVMKSPKSELTFSNDRSSIRQFFLSRRQKSQGGLWIVGELWQRFVSSFLQDANVAWFNYLDVGKENVHLVAGNGDKVTDAINQLSSLEEAVNGRMPDKTFMFFSGLDLCAIAPEYILNSDSYRQNLDQISEYISLNFNEVSGKTLYVVSPLNLLQIVSSDRILKANRRLNDESKSCKFLQTNSFRLNRQS